MIYGRQIIKGPSEPQFEIANINKTLTRRARHQFKLLNDFTRQRRREYLLGLREHGSCSRGHGQPQRPSVRPGNIVILKDDIAHHCWWKLARVTKLITGRDGHVRAAKVLVRI